MSKARNNQTSKGFTDDVHKREKGYEVPPLLQGEELTALTPDDMHRVLEKLEEFAQSHPERRGGEEALQFPKK